MNSSFASFENEIKGRSGKEIRAYIRELREDMQAVKDMMECPDGRGLEPRYDPTAELRLERDRECMKLCIREIEENGAGYKPDKAERRAMAFQAELEHISKVSFSIGGFFEGTTEYCIEFCDEAIRCSFSSMFGDREDEKRCLTTMEGNHILTKSEFIQYLSSLHMGEWLEEYYPERFGIAVCDGTQWEIRIEYDDGTGAAEFYGSNSYPYNFERFQYLFGLSFD